LAQRSNIEGQPSLVIHCYPPTKPHLARVPLSGMVEDMRAGMLSPEPISFRKVHAVSTIQMELQFDESEPCLISGFPRSCAALSSASDLEHRERQPGRHAYKSPASSERASSLKNRGVDWKPPPRLDGLPHIDLGHYADPTRTLGGRRVSSSPNRGNGTEIGGLAGLVGGHGSLRQSGC